MTQDPPSISIAPPKDTAEVNEFVRIVSQALVFPPVDYEDFVRREGRENITATYVGDKVAGGVILQPMGMSLGGRILPLACVRVVGIAPEHRSKGLGHAIMDHVIRDSYKKGFPLSALFPATLPVYRRAGFELAGSRTTYRYAMATIGKLKRTLEIREATNSDRPILEGLYAKRLARSPGNIQRNDWAWERIIDPPSWWPRSYGYIVEQDGHPAGYVYFAQKPGGHITDNTISVVDFSWESAEAGLSLLSMIADHRSMATAFEFCGSPSDPATLLMCESAIQKTTRYDWMLRIVNLKDAIERRGFHPNTVAELHLNIDDPTIQENCGNCIVSVSDGQASFKKGGDGRLTASIRELASLYSGFMSAESLCASGGITGDKESIATASGLFAGPIPWMSDMF